MKAVPRITAQSMLALLLATPIGSVAGAENAAQMVQACTQLNHEYAIARDSGDTAAYARIFSDEAEFVMQGKTYVGKDAILTRLTSPEPRYFARLLVSTVVITPLDQFSARGVTYFTMFQALQGDEGDRPPVTAFTTFMGEYLDHYEFSEGVCRLSRRETRPLFMGTAEEK